MSTRLLCRRWDDRLHPQKPGFSEEAGLFWVSSSPPAIWRAIAPVSWFSPWPVTAEISRTSRCSSSASRWRTSAAPGNSHLVTTTISGRAQPLVVLPQFVADRPIIGDRVGAVQGRWFDQMDQDSSSFHVPEKLQTQPDARVRAFDQARDVRHDERSVAIDLHASQVRMFGGKGIIGDGRTSFRQAAQQRALAGVRLAEQAHVGDHLQLEDQLAALTLFAFGKFAWRLIRGRFEMCVSPAAFAAACGHELFVRLDQVFEDELILRVDHHGPRRNKDGQILAAAAVSVGAFPAASLFGARTCGEPRW